jgi:lipopolysaccharide export LptBFGC system permease protein LptF
MIKIDKKTKDQLLEMYKTKKISLEGNILKVIDSDGDEEFESYIKESIEKDKDNRRKRLEITRQIQSRNNDLIKSEKENERVNKELKEALEEAENLNKQSTISKEDAEKARDEANISMLDAQRAREEAEISMLDAQKSKEDAENAKKVAVNDLELIQKKSQFELIGTIVRVALWVILGVGVVTTGMYLLALSMGLDTSVIGSTWSNIIGILLTNAFSIVGTIMGVKYASENNKGS